MLRCPSEHPGLYSAIKQVLGLDEYSSNGSVTVKYLIHPFSLQGEDVYLQVRTFARTGRLLQNQRGDAQPESRHPLSLLGA